MECTTCRKRLELGVDALSLQETVLGPRGLVPLADALAFCSEDCLREHVGAEREVPRRSRRIA